MTMLFTSGGSTPGTATGLIATDAGTGNSASIAFTPPSYIGKGTITYTATSSPGSFTGSSSGSPITVSGLTPGTSYTFTIVGTTNYGVQSAVSAASNSVTIAAAAAFESIATLTPSGTDNATFSTIPSTYTDLQLRVYMLGVTGGVANVYSIQFNGDTTSTYYTSGVFGYGTNAIAGAATGTSGIRATVGNMVLTNNKPMASIIDISSYASTTRNKSTKQITGMNAGTNMAGVNSGLLATTSAISSITVRSQQNFGAGTVLALYGIKAAL